MTPLPSIAGIILCGGESRRMGCDKAMLPFGAETMLQRVVRILTQAASPIVVSAAAEQTLPSLDAAVRIVRDPASGRGPWQGVAAGLRAVAEESEFAFVTTCDAPFLRPNWVGRLVELIGDRAAAVPWVDGYWQPLSALYRPAAVLPVIDELLADTTQTLSEKGSDPLSNREAKSLQNPGGLTPFRTAQSPLALFDRVPTRRVIAEELRDIDPFLESLRNINSPEDYRKALRDAGLASDAAAQI
jgi:molybdopterin-guanine dinucleotide biosynthesis protein A